MVSGQITFLICCHVLNHPEPLSSSGTGLLSVPRVRTKHCDDVDGDDDNDGDDDEDDSCVLRV